MLRVGLTGGIACGKSHVLRRLAARGLPTLDLDEVAHELMAPGAPAHAEVVAAFGRGVLAGDGGIDRRALGARVFVDEAARERLNAIVHPRVRAEEARQAARVAGRGGSVFVTDAALIVETGVHLGFDRLVVVHCPPDEQVRRLVRRDGLDEGAARARLAAQMPIEEKRRYGHLAVDTSGTIAETEAGADRVAADLLSLAAHPSAPRAVPPERARGLLARGPARGPRGLEPAGLLAEIAAAGGLEMERVAARLVPPGEGPWYRRGRAGEPGPETLAGPLVLWVLARRGRDPALALAAAFSLAQATHGDPESAAAACFFALALLDVAGRDASPAGFAGRTAVWSAQAEAWAGAAPPERVLAAVAAAADPASAGSGPGLAAGIAGLLIGVAADDAPPAVREALRRFAARPFAAAPPFAADPREP